MPNRQRPTINENNQTLLRHNVFVESCFSACNGIFLGLIWFGSHVVAERGLGAGALHLAILVCAFPAGAFLGPVWAAIGRRWGMKNLVCVSLALASLALLPIYFVTDATMFTVFVAFGQLMNSAMRMGQASLYRAIYPQASRGRILGRLTFWTYATMVPSMLLMGLLLDVSRDMYRYVYPLAALLGIGGCLFYYRLRVPGGEVRSTTGNVGQDLWQFRGVLRRDRLYRLYELAFFLTGGAFFLSRAVIVKLTAVRFEFSALELMIVLSVIPPILLAAGSLLWGRILDRLGLIRCRLLISTLMAAALVCYFIGLHWRIAALIYTGSILQGISNGGGHLTWFLGSSFLARRNEDVPLYNGIHFLLNGVRGMVLPWVGAGLMMWSGAGAVAAAAVVSFGSVPVLLRALALRDERLDGKPILWFVRRKNVAAEVAEKVELVDEEEAMAETRA